MRISSRTHAVLDLATAGLTFAAPRLLGASDELKRATTSIALAKLGYTLLTRHELGVVRLLPMKMHLSLDVASGAALAALPLLKKEKPAVAAFAIGAGAFDIAAAALTDPKSLPPRIPGVTAGVTTMLGADEPARVVPPEQMLPQASFIDSLKVNVGVITPTVAMGPIIRRPRVMKVAEGLGLPTAAVKTLQRMRDKYGSGPLMIKMPLRYQAVVIDPDHVRRILEETPEPFATASMEKQAALAHFEPKVALVSHGPQRAERRRLNVEVLKNDSPVHPLAERQLGVVDEEADRLLRKVEEMGELRWEEFSYAWFCMVRRIVFGDAARNDHRITDLMERLRRDGNWAFLKPVRKDLRDELHQRIRDYLERGEIGSLAASMPDESRGRISAPENQIPQWLFAFDPAAMATFRALALLATHSGEMERAHGEYGEARARPHRPFLRAAVLESLRLWPTTPMILRHTTRETEWENGVMPAHTSILIYTPFFHRDESHLPYAHAFHPDIWFKDDPEVKGNPPREWPFVPFSGGTGICPGRNVVLLLTSGMLAAILGKCDVQLQHADRLPPARLPGMLNHFTLRFDVQRRSRAVQPGMAAIDQRSSGAR